MIHELPDGLEVERLLGHVLEGAPDGIIAVDRDGRIVFASVGALVQFDYAATELVGKPIEILVPSASAEQHAKERSEFQLAPISRPMRGYGAINGVRQDGSEFPVEISLTPIDTSAGSLTVAIVRDVSDRVNADLDAAEARYELELTSERERIARDLHDTIIQELFATGMSMQAVLGRVNDDLARERLSRAIDSLDDCIRRIRTVIFGLTAHSAWGRGLRGEILKVAADESAVLGFEPGVVFSGAVDALADEHATHVVAVVRETMSNIARHSQASAASITVQAIAEELTVTVADNGRGMPADVGACSGLANLRSRAVELGGTLDIESEQGRGTVVELRVPLA